MNELDQLERDVEHAAYRWAVDGVDVGSLIDTGRKLVALCRRMAAEALAAEGQWMEETGRLNERIKHLTNACAKQDNEICQTLGKVMGFFWYKDDPVNFPEATEADGVCVGEYLAEDMAVLAAKRITDLKWRKEPPDRIGMWAYRSGNYGYGLCRCDDLTDDVAELSWFDAIPEGVWDGEWKWLGDGNAQ